MYEIVIGRDDEDRKNFGTEGTFLLAKHYVQMGQSTSLSNKILMDAARSHVIFVCGKRGSGKSYTMSAMAEGITELSEEVQKNLAVLMIDTMGIFWTMKHENLKDQELLKEWNLAPGKINVKVFTPKGHYMKIKNMGIPTDAPFSIRTSELSISDWCQTFGISEIDPIGILIGKILSQLKGDYSIEEILEHLEKDKSDKTTKSAVENLFLIAKNWGLFSKDGTQITDILEGGQVTVLDVSPYASSQHSQNIRALVIGLVCQKIFDERMEQRRAEEFKDIQDTEDYFAKPKVDKKNIPVTWIMIDEAHEFLPKEGQTTATKALLTLLREGRQPGVSLVLASQQPGQIHTDVLTQSDVVIAHRLTAKIDIDALGLLMQSYMRQNLDKQLSNLPDVKGAALLFDDTNERIYQIRVRPKITWHGGSSPSTINQEKSIFNF